MNSNEFSIIYHQVKQNLFWGNFKASKEVKAVIEKKHKFKFITKDELEKKIEQLKKFDINLIWDKSFWGLSKSDSISAVASEPYYFLKKLKENKYELAG